MRVIITGRHFSVSTGLKKAIEEKLEKIRFFYDHVLNFHVIIEKEKIGYKIEVDFVADGKHFYVQEKGEALNEAVDLLIDKVERLVKRHKEKMQQRNNRGKRVVTEETLSTSGDKVNFIEIDEKPKNELEFLLQLALSPDDIGAFYTEEEPSNAILVIKEDNNYFQLIGKDSGQDRYISKRVYLENDKVVKTDMEDYVPRACTLSVAISEIDRGNHVVVFYNNDDHQLQALYRAENELYNLIPLGG